MTEKVVLIVEDDASMREVLEDTLRDSGYTVAVAEDGAKAVLVMQRTRVDIVVTDVQMSPMDGWELLDCLKTEYPGRT